MLLDSGIGKDRGMAVIMGNASVHSHNSVPVADSSEAQGTTPL